MSAKVAAKSFGIPRTTLGDRLRGRIHDEARPGRRSVVPKEIEDMIVKEVADAADKGFGIGKNELLHRVGQLCVGMGVKTPFTNGKPGKDWWQAFLKRNPGIRVRKPEPLTNVRSRAVNPTILGQFF